MGGLHKRGGWDTLDWDLGATTMALGGGRSCVGLEYLAGFGSALLFSGRQEDGWCFMGVGRWGQPVIYEAWQRPTERMEGAILYIRDDEIVLRW